MNTVDTQKIEEIVRVLCNKNIDSNLTLAQEVGLQEAQVLELVKTQQCAQTFHSQSYTSTQCNQITDNVINLFSTTDTGDKESIILAKEVSRHLYEQSQINVLQSVVENEDLEKNTIDIALSQLLPKFVGLKYLTSPSLAALLEMFEINYSFANATIDSLSQDEVVLLLHAASVSEKITDEQYTQMFLNAASKHKLQSKITNSILCRLIQVALRSSEAGLDAQTFAQFFKDKFTIPLDTDFLHDSLPIMHTSSNKQRDLYRDLYINTVKELCFQALIPPGSAIGASVAVNMVSGDKLSESQKNSANVLLTLISNNEYYLGEDIYKEALNNWLKSSKKPHFATFFELLGDGRVFFKYPSLSEYTLQGITKAMKSDDHQKHDNAYFLYYSILAALYKNKNFIIKKAKQGDSSYLSLANKLANKTFLTPQNSRKTAVLNYLAKEDVTVKLLKHFDVQKVNSALIDLAATEILSSKESGELSRKLSDLVETAFCEWCLDEGNQNHFNAQYEIRVVQEVLTRLTRTAKNSSIDPINSQDDFVLEANLLKVAVAKGLDCVTGAQHAKQFGERLRLLTNFIPQWSNYAFKKPIKLNNGESFYTAADTIDYISKKAKTHIDYESKSQKWLRKQDLIEKERASDNAGGVDELSMFKKFLSLFSKNNKEKLFTSNTQASQNHDFQYISKISFCLAGTTVILSSNSNANVDTAQESKEQNTPLTSYDSPQVAQKMAKFLTATAELVSKKEDLISLDARIQVQSFSIDYKKLKDLISVAAIDMHDGYSVVQMMEYFNQSMQIYTDAKEKLRALGQVSGHSSESAQELIEENFLHQTKTIHNQCINITQKLATQISFGAQKQSRVHSTLLNNTLGARDDLPSANNLELTAGSSDISNNSNNSGIDIDSETGVNSEAEERDQKVEFAAKSVVHNKTLKVRN